MSKQAAILFEDFGPYHVARIQALAQALAAESWGLTAYRMSERSPTYLWNPPEIPASLSVLTLNPVYPRGLLASLRAAWGFSKALRSSNTLVAYLPSYSPLPNTLCLVFARFMGCRCIMMNDSWAATEKPNRYVKIIKGCLIRMFSAAIVAGSRHRAYAVRYGIPDSKVFSGYDVVDVAYFERAARQGRLKPGLKLPRRYFLNIGRFVAKKNLGVLISAYAKLVRRQPELEIALVLVGAGDCLDQLREQAGASGLPWHDGLATEGEAQGPGVFHYPFQQIDALPEIYARCEAFVLPSTIEEWGLVVNEAMACGAAVVVSNMVGCAPDLVREGDNGFQFDPGDTDALAGILKRFVEDPGLSRRMGTRGNEIIQEWTPETFAKSGMLALKACFS